MNIHGSSAVEIATPLSASTVHEAAGRIGALPSAIKPLSQHMLLTAPALPVRVPAGDNLWLHRAVYEAQPGEALVVDVGEGAEYGYWGEILTAAAIARGVAGLVINGGVRDVRQLVDLGWPVFAERICLRGTGKDADSDGDVGGPVRIGDVTVRRGDLIVADADGVVAICAERSAEVRIAALERDRAELMYLDRIRSGDTTLAIYELP